MAKKKKGQRADGLVEIKRKMADGTYKHFYGSSKAECETKYREALIQAAQAAEAHAAGPLFSTLADEWWGKRYSSLSPNTQRTYRSMFKRVVNDFGNVYASAITPNIVSLWLDSFATNGRAKKTAANYKIILSDILQYGHERYNLPINPAKNITLPAGMKMQKRKMPDAWQLTLIMQNYETDWVCQIYYIFAFTGLRLGELLALQWKDLDPAEQTISVTKAVYWESTRPMLKDPKTEAGARVLPYLPQVQAVLEPQRRRSSLYVIHGPRSSGESPMTRTSYYKMLEHAKKLGLTSTPHALRHAFATLCCEYEVDARTAGAIFGWTNPSRMEDIYAEIRQKKVLHAGELLANAEY